MRRTASEVLRELQIRVARLERRATLNLHDENDFREMLEDWSLEDLAEYFVARHFREIPPYGPIRITQEREFDKELHAIGRTLSMSEQRPFMGFVDKFLGTTFQETRVMFHVLRGDVNMLINRRALNKNLSPDEMQAIKNFEDHINNYIRTGIDDFDKVKKVLAKKQRALSGWKHRNP